MSIHYYLGWFNNFFPETLSRLLQEDITDRMSLVMISSNPSIYEDDGATERSWLDQAGIMFDEYHLINYRVQKEEAQSKIQNASVIFLLGGDTLKQNGFLREYELSNLIKESSAVVIGASAGAINMSAKWLCSKNLGNKVEMSSVYEGIGLNNFSVLSHFDLENNIAMVQSELSPLSEEINIYASNKDCAVRVKGDSLDVFGTVFLISHSKIRKLDETLQMY
ncbi:Type 1 glutamine amidotransferase-like domain-containing protein [Pseudalkalibacillus berkeleyi]|uniref:Type 1 glutamine amidotransferase-like domain-containing protein n=1 Tax=Pseudalkalibacillus berkeleyi TaxID=1069813 RepID=A0ABS9H2R0_9BACL|nr:Type 1 glutamine amidotransferase-like domain-containing protein [Pseudalkalibacillus berkeleyi]MCF6138255.1 Type 1 glutamine amidotransferase-like domain-containing protein [Pseudalkalibacillus berkeleyi]